MMVSRAQKTDALAQDFPDAGMIREMIGASAFLGTHLITVVTGMLPKARMVVFQESVHPNSNLAQR